MWALEEMIVKGMLDKSNHNKKDGDKRTATTKDGEPIRNKFGEQRGASLFKRSLENHQHQSSRLQSSISPSPDELMTFFKKMLPGRYLPLKELLSTQCGKCLVLFQNVRCLLEGIEDSDKLAVEYHKEESLKVLEEAYLEFQAWRAKVGALEGEHLYTSIDFRLREVKMETRQSVSDTLRSLEDDLNEAQAMISERSENKTDSFSFSDIELPPNFEFPPSFHFQSDIDVPSDIDSSSESDPFSEIDFDNWFKNHMQGKTMLRSNLSSAKSSTESLMESAILILGFGDSITNDYWTVRSQSQISPQSDIDYVIKKHGQSKDFEPWLADRMGRVITWRREYLAFREKQAMKTTKEWDEYFENLDRPSEEELAALRAAINLDQDNSRCSGGTPTELTDSETSDESTEVGNSDEETLKVPSPPIWAFEDIKFEYGKPFMCPFCYTEQNVKDFNLWKRHVFRDLKTYVCTFQECDLLMFSSRDEWFDHEMTVHRAKWTCSDCRDESFHSEGSFIDHLKYEHRITDYSHVDNLLLKGSKPFEKIPANACHLCNDWEKFVDGGNPDPGSGTPHEFKKHLARHMEELALFALPSEYHVG